MKHRSSDQAVFISNPDGCGVGPPSEAAWNMISHPSADDLILPIDETEHQTTNAP